MGNLLTSYAAHLSTRKNSERMFLEIQPNVNPLSNKMKSIGYQIVYDHRSKPIIDGKLYHSQTLLTDASQGLDKLELGDVFDFDKLQTKRVG